MKRMTMIVNDKAYEVKEAEIRDGFVAPESDEDAEKMFDKLVDELSDFRKCKVEARLIIAMGKTGIIPPVKEALQIVIDVWGGKGDSV